MEVDFLGFGAHPDDVELSSGGLFAKMSAKNYNLMIVDLTRGEAATRGTPIIRAEEAKKASQLLKLKERINLGLPDSNITITWETKKEIAKIIRKFRPKIIVAPYWEDRHPDHVCTSNLITESTHIASLRAIDLQAPAWRPSIILYAIYHEFIGLKPSFFVDISDWMEIKKQLVMCYSSQFYNPSSEEPHTLLSQGGFLSALEARARIYGELNGVQYAEGYITRKPIMIDDPVAQFNIHTS